MFQTSFITVKRGKRQHSFSATSRL